jgi:hypothetical protein
LPELFDLRGISMNNYPISYQSVAGSLDTLSFNVNQANLASLVKVG